MLEIFRYIFQGNIIGTTLVRFLYSQGKSREIYGPEKNIKSYYRKVSNIRRTESQNLNDSCLGLQLSSPSPLKLGGKSRMKT